MKSLNSNNNKKISISSMKEKESSQNHHHSYKIHLYTNLFHQQRSSFLGHLVLAE